MSSFEATKICRTCLGLDGILLSIYDSKSSNDSGCIADMLREINVEAKKCGGMPEKVCLMCISEINRCYSFKMKCDNSDRTLRHLLNIPKDIIQLELPKGNRKRVYKATTTEEEDVKRTRPKLVEGNQDEIFNGDNSSSVIENNVVLSDQDEEEISFFNVKSGNNELLEEEIKNEEVLNNENSSDDSIIFTHVNDTQDDEAQMIDDSKENLKESPHHLMVECTSRETKLLATCYLCQMSFVHMRNLEKHMIKVHNASEVITEHISKQSVVPILEKEVEFSREETTKNKEEYNLQFIEEIEESKCQEAQFSIQNIEDQVEELRCQRCRAFFASKSSLNIHIKLNKCTIPQFSCGDCKKVFISLNSLEEHMKTHKFFCETCGENLHSKQELSKHLDAHPKHEGPNYRKALDRRNKMRMQRRKLRDTANPFDLPEERFRELYRLSRDAAHILLGEIRPHMKKGQRKTFIPISIRLCAALHFYASGSYQRDIGQDFSAAMSRTMVSRIVAEVSTVLQNHLSAKLISFPKEDEYDAIKQSFFKATGFPGVIGAVDCTHVKIKKPNNEIEASYLHRKGYHSKNVQLVCDFNLRIFGVHAHFGGASHDSIIWEQSLIKSILEQRYEARKQEEHNSWLLGDSGYPLRPWLMTPYSSLADDDERAFNAIHAQTRNCVERLNGVLKSIFRCLRIGLFYSPQAAGKIINACCVLHNFRIKHGIVDDISIEDIEPDEENVYHNTGSTSAHHRTAILIRDRLKANILR